MKFRAHYCFRPDCRNEVIQRFQETGGTPPGGVEMLGRYHATSGYEGWVRPQTDGGQAQMEWIMHCSDHLDFTITPVVDDAEFTEVLQRVF